MPALRLALCLALKVASQSLNGRSVEGYVIRCSCYKVILLQMLLSLSPGIRLCAIPYNDFASCRGLFHGSSVYGLLVGLPHPCMQSNTVAFYKKR